MEQQIALRSRLSSLDDLINRRGELHKVGSVIFRSRLLDIRFLKPTMTVKTPQIKQVLQISPWYDCSARLSEEQLSAAAEEYLRKNASFLIASPPVAHRVLPNEIRGYMYREPPIRIRWTYLDHTRAENFVAPSPALERVRELEDGGVMNSRADVHKTYKDEMFYTVNTADLTGGNGAPLLTEQLEKMVEKEVRRRKMFPGADSTQLLDQPEYFFDGRQYKVTLLHI